MKRKSRSNLSGFFMLHLLLRRRRVRAHARASAPRLSRSRRLARRARRAPLRHQPDRQAVRRALRSKLAPAIRARARARPDSDGGPVRKSHSAAYAPPTYRRAYPRARNRVRREPARTTARDFSRTRFGMQDERASLSQTPQLARLFKAQAARASLVRAIIECRKQAAQLPFGARVI